MKKTWNMIGLFALTIFLCLLLTEILQAPWKRNPYTGYPDYYETGGASTFVGLTDTPANYTNAGLKVLRVNSGATAVEFTKFIGTGLYDNGNSGASITIDWNNGNIQTVTLTAVGVDITFTEPPHPGKCELWIIQDGTGSRTIDWEHEVSPKWPGDVEPVLSTAANAVDVVVFTFIGSTTYRGLANLDFK